MKIQLVIPYQDSINASTFESLWNLDKGSHIVDFRTKRGYAVKQTYYDLIANPMKSYDAVFIIKSNLVVPSSSLLDLISCGGFDTLNPCAMATGWHRINKDLCNINHTPNMGGDYFDAKFIETSSNPFEVFGCDLTFVLINLSWLKKNNFDAKWLDEDLKASGLEEAGHAKFCQQVYSRGGKIICNPAVKADQLIRMTI